MLNRMGQALFLLPALMPTPIQTKDDVPAASPGWWDQFAAMAKARPQAVEDRLFDELIKTRDFAPADPDKGIVARRLAKKLAQALMRPGITLLLLTLVALLHPAPTYAMQPAEAAGPTVTYCVDRDELAGVLMVEGGAQPTADIIRMGQIVKAEADSRGLTICALTRLTNFVTVRHFIEAHPNSYAAHRFASPPEWALDLAQGVLTDQFEDMRGGAGHWDGSADGMRIIFKP